MEEEIAVQRTELTDLRNQWDNLVETKCITPEHADRIAQLEFETGEQLLEREMETAAEYQKLKEEKAILKDSVEELRSELEDLQKRYDDTQLELKQFKAAAEIVVPFFDEGYANDHFWLLLDGLRKVGITGEPQQSITRLLRTIDFNKKLVELEKKREEEIHLEAKLKTVFQKREC